MAAGNATAVRRAVENIWNLGDLTLADHLFDPAYVNHGGLIPDLVHGPEAIKFSVALYRTAFPRLVITIDHLEADGDTVELGWTAHTSWRDRSVTCGPRSRRQTLRGTTRSRLSHGQIVESWTSWDGERVLRHLFQAAEIGRNEGLSTSLAHLEGRHVRQQSDG